MRRPRSGRRSSPAAAWRSLRLLLDDLGRVGHVVGDGLHVVDLDERRAGPATRAVDREIDRGLHQQRFRRARGVLALVLLDLEEGFLHQFVRILFARLLAGAPRGGLAPACPPGSASFDRSPSTLRRAGRENPTIHAMRALCSAQYGSDKRCAAQPTPARLREALLFHPDVGFAVQHRLIGCGRAMSRRCAVEEAPCRVRDSITHTMAHQAGGHQAGGHQAGLSPFRPDRYAGDDAGERTHAVPARGPAPASGPGATSRSSPTRRSSRSSTRARGSRAGR